MHILLIEDEINVSRFIKKGLEEQGYTVHVAYDGHTGIELFSRLTVDIIVLDLVLPNLDGLNVCKKIRSMGMDVPILMLTALGTLQNKVTGLDSGADDYLTKPFHFQELLARIRSLTRRNRGLLVSEQIIKIEDLVIDVSAKTVHRSNQEIPLTFREFKLLELLANNKGRVMSRSQIAEHIWESAFENGSNVIDVYINYLRKKIDLNHDRKLIHTVIGMGYVLR